MFKRLTGDESGATAIEWGSNNMGFQVDDEVVITQFGTRVITQVVLRWEDKEGISWLNLKDPQTGTLFRRKESIFTEVPRAFA